MQKSLPIILILALLAAAGFILFFINQSRLTEKDAVMQDQLLTLQEEQQRLSDIEEQLRGEMLEKDRLASEAMQARQMAEALAEQERREREKLVTALNERLKQEASERAEAEAAQRQLEQRMEELAAAQREAQAALAMLETARDTSAEQPPEAVELQKKLDTQRMQLAALESENLALKQRQQQLEQRQIATEEAIVSAGGRVEIPFPEIRSPNVRRRDAILFKQRLSGPQE